MTLAREHRFNQEVEAQMFDFYQTLSEEERRRYAAIEAKKLPSGGIRYIANVLGCSENTIACEIKELTQLASGD